MPVKQIRSKAVGQKFHPGAHDALIAAISGASVDLVREPENEADPNAIAVWLGPRKVGYIPSKQAELIAPEIDAGRLRAAILDGYNGLIIDLAVDNAPAEELF